MSTGFLRKIFGDDFAPRDIVILIGGSIALFALAAGWGGISRRPLRRRTLPLDDSQ